MPGTAVFLNPGEATTPLALRGLVEHTHMLHAKVVIVSVDTVAIPVIDPADRFAVCTMGHGLLKVTHVTIRCGYRSRQDVPEGLRQARKEGLLERNLDLEHASYFLSHITITPNGPGGMRRWRKKLFVMMARNAASPIEAFHLPSELTVILGSQVGGLSARAEQRPRAGCRHRRAKRGKSGAASRIFHGMSRWRAGCGKSKRARRIFHGLHGVFAIQWGWSCPHDRAWPGESAERSTWASQKQRTWRPQNDSKWPIPAPGEPGPDSAKAAGLPERLFALVGGAAEDEQQVREPVEVSDRLRVDHVAAGDHPPLGAPTDGPAHV